MLFSPTVMLTKIQWCRCNGTEMATGCWLRPETTSSNCSIFATWRRICNLSRVTRKRPQVGKIGQDSDSSEMQLWELTICLNLNVKYRPPCYWSTQIQNSRVFKFYISSVILIIRVPCLNTDFTIVQLFTSSYSPIMVTLYIRVS